jgi:hypothetical protein
MTESDDPQEQRAKLRIELEPVVYGVSEVPPEPPPREEPIPERPLHLCPHCEYNLTGLTSRRCPECGKPFTLRQAKDRGLGILDEKEDDRLALRRGRRMLGLGIALVVFGFACPWIAVRIGASGLNAPASIRLWFMYYFAAPVGCALAFLCRYDDQGWPRTMMTVGIVMALMGLYVALL